MHYYAQIEPDGAGWLVTFPDVPEAITGGEDRGQALANATDALELALLTYTKDGKAWPSVGTAVGEPVAVRAVVLAKVAFISAFEDSGMTQVALARRMGKGETEVRRMLDPYHQTKLASIETGLLALGKRLVISVEAA